jgi:hypothetical protein
VQFEAERGIWSGRFADVLPPDCCGSSDVIRASNVMEYPFASRAQIDISVGAARNVVL